MSDHPIDPSTPRAGWLATVELPSGSKRTRYFADPKEAWEWVDNTMSRHGFLRTQGRIDPVS